jgi:hypothetical protein
LFDTEREDRFTVEELGFLHEVLDSNAVVYEGNKDTVVEALRSIAELMIWGDQHDASFFEFFAEHQTLSYFHRILSQRYCRSGEVAVQILQTLSILTQNIQSEQAIYFLFSNNHVNQIIMQDFNFKDDEVLGYYISFLKTISLKLNSGTVQFFFRKKQSGNRNQGDQDSSSADSNQHRTDFPFYSRIIQFLRNEESMVRAAVRTCTLNIYSVEDAGVRHFLINSQEANAYLVNLGKYVLEQCQALGAILPATQQGTIDPKRLDVALEELDDIFYYCYDVYSLVPEGVGEKLMCAIWKELSQVLLEPFKIRAGGGSDSSSSSTSSTSTSTSPRSPMFTVSLLILERLFHIMNMPGLLNAIFASMFLPRGKALQLAPLILSADVEDPRAQEGWWYDAWPVFKQCVSNEQMHLESTLVVRFLTMCIKSKCLEEDVMDAAGLLPGRIKASRELLNELTSTDNNSEIDNQNTTVGGKNADAKASAGGRHRRMPSREQLAEMKLFQQEESASNAKSSSIPLVTERLEQVNVEDDAVARDGQDEAPYLVFAALLKMDPFRIDLINIAGWMLHQWLPLCNSNSPTGRKVSEEPIDELEREAVFSPRKSHSGVRLIPKVLSNVLDGQMEECVARLRTHLQHAWCDGIPLLIQTAWQRNRRHLISPQISMNAVETSKFLLQNQGNNASKGNRDYHKNPGTSTAIVAAQQANQAVNAFVAIAQLKAWLSSGELPNSPSGILGLDERRDIPCSIVLDEPVGLVPHEQRPLAVSDCTEINLSSIKLFGQQSNRESSQEREEDNEDDQTLTRGALPCKVAFTRGAERNVYFCLDGRHTLPSSKKKFIPALGSVCIFLADTNECSANLPKGTFAKVVAMAPLAGAEPAIDPTHPSWLHIRVRPPLSALMAVCSMMNNAQEQSFGAQPAKRPKLNDGRWTLAFEDGESAKKAKEMVESQRKQLRANADNLLNYLNV